MGISSISDCLTIAILDYRFHYLFGVFYKGDHHRLFLHFLYFEGSFFGTDWVRPFFNEFRLNIEYVFSINWTEFTDFF